MKRAILGSALAIGFLLTGTAPALAAAGDQPCMCTKEYAPVIGSDGKTYGNACEAGCAGVEVVGPAGAAGGSEQSEATGSEQTGTSGSEQTGTSGSEQSEATGSGHARNCPKPSDPYSP